MSLKSSLLELLNHPVIGRAAGLLGGFTAGQEKLGGLTNPFYVADYLVENDDGIAYHAPAGSYLATRTRPRRRVGFISREYEPEVQFLMRKLVRPDHIVLDIGANVGVHTTLLARLAHQGHVYAFEPVDEMAERNSLNCSLNGIRNVTLVRCGLGDTDGELEMNVNVSGGGYEGTSSFLATSHIAERPADYVSRKLPVRRLDDVVAELGITGRIGFIKMDTEGFEPLIIDGGRRTLAEHRPALIVEAHSTRLARLGRSFGWYREVFPDYHILLAPEPTPANPSLQLIPLDGEPPETCVNLLLLPRIPSVIPAAP
ncbi:methyltransferase FkbM family domain protein [Paramagnetospirillum magnetotacticum MS-1]|uniref:Methyltransferase FkbM family domain protein n=1 Tax=Paramagnetospirillum magnetotacticum MS-1 TaxID=272627 RepID=A0A0C2YDD9_PARME|nr:FkbM family methyltransferase [Paramagnetospirillum magnetotacticum]KIL97719.1 methyltransferase FkbM family domain protein [Paramagnetospirillum magnetotacticum MS-1]